MANVGELKVSRLAHRETFTRSQKGRLAPFFPRVPPLVLQQLCGGNRWSVLFPKFSPRIILDPPTVQVPAAQRPLPLCGLWRGTYGSHGVELLHVEAAPGGLSPHLREARPTRCLHWRLRGAGRSGSWPRRSQATLSSSLGRWDSQTCGVLTH